MSILAQAAQGNVLTAPNGKQYTNNNSIPRELAIFAIYHNSLYDGAPTTATNLSVSDLLLPMRKLIYKIQNPTVEALTDVSTLIKSSKGTCMHTGLESALSWWGGYTQEIRGQTVIDGVTISGKFDVIDESTNILKDLKNVSNYSYKKLLEDISKLTDLDPTLFIKQKLEQIPTYTKFQFQLSAYKWLNPQRNLQPFGDIIFSLNDGGGMERFPVDNFHRFALFLDEEVHDYVVNFISELRAHLAADTLPNCSDSERGYSPAEYKLERYYPNSNSNRTVPGSKFSNEREFRDFVIAKGKLGDTEVIKEAAYALCNYCAYSSICTQE